MLETQSSSPAPSAPQRLCPHHNKEIIKLCISLQCTSQSQAMCADCWELHAHKINHEVSINYLRELWKQRTKLDSKAVEQCSQVLQKVRLIKAEMLNLFQKNLTSVFQKIESKFTLSADPDCALNELNADQLFGLNPEVIRNKLKQLQCKQKPPENFQSKFVAVSLEIKVILSEIQKKLQQTLETALIYSRGSICSEGQSLKIQLEKHDQLSDRLAQDLNCLSQNIKSLVLTRVQQESRKSEMKEKIKKARSIQAENKDIRTPEILRLVKKEADEIINISPYDYYGYFQKAYISFDHKYFETAILLYSICLELNAPKDLTLNNKGMSFTHMKRFKDAIPCFDESCIANPAYIGAFLNKGVCYYEQKKYYECFICMQRVLRAKDDHAVALEYKKKSQSYMQKSK